MILEIAQLQIKRGEVAKFEAVFSIAERINAAMPGHIGHELQRCIENDHHFMWLVRWQTLEDHTVGFRQSAQYQEWRKLLHHFYDPFPTVLHYEAIAV